MQRIIVILFILLNIKGFAQTTKQLQAAYILKYKDIAITKMHEFKIPASITIAQGILESGCGLSELAINANNHFGIKCHKGWGGLTYSYDDDSKGECFRKYNSAEESFDDHSLFLTRRERYSDLFKLNIRDYSAWAHGLKKAGYATSPTYAKQLIKIIEDNELYNLDNIKLIETKDVAILSNDNAELQLMVSNTTPNNNDKINSTQEESDNYIFIEISETNRNVYENNGTKFIFAKKGDTFFAIANDFFINSYQIKKYNELENSDLIREGDIIYIVPKQKKAKVDFHIMKQNETLRTISQKYAIKLSIIKKRNPLFKNDEPAVGTKIWLNSKSSK